MKNSHHYTNTGAGIFYQYGPSNIFQWKGTIGLKHVTDYMYNI